MLYILNKQERVVQTLKNGDTSTPFFEDKLIENLETGVETFTFISLLNEMTSKGLQVGNFVAFMKDDKYKLFQIMEVNEVHEETLEVEVYCECAGLELLNSVCRAKTLPSADLRTFANEVLLDSGWNVGFIDVTNSIVRDLELENNSIYATLQNHHKEYAVELEFRCEINGGRVSGKYVDFHGFRGRDNGKRFEFSKNIAGVRRTTDVTELYTALIGEGKNGITFKDITVPDINKPAGQDFVVNDEAYYKYNKNGRHLMGVFKYETESPEELLRETAKRLEELSKPKVTYEVDVEILDSVLNIGDTVSVVDHYFNPPILLKARVNQLETSKTNPQNDKCVLSNFVEISSNINNILGDLEGYIDSSIGSKFPIGTDQIQDGAVNGDKIYQNSIATDHLIADAITADKIQANSIKTKHLEAESITADKIQTGTITAESGVIGSLTADVITTGTLNGANVNVTNINASNISTGVLDAKHINVTNINATNIVTGTLDASKINVTNLNADSITAGTINGSLINVTDLNASNIVTGTLDASKANITNLSANSITAGTIDASKIQVINLDATNITSGSINADIIEGLIITGDMITAGTIDASKANIINIDASNITTGKISADLIEGMVITADMITTGTLDASLVNVINLNATNITAGTIDASKVKITNLNAGSITGGEIDASKITVSNINADKITLGTLNGELVNVTNLNASNITGGKIDTSRLNVSSQSGNLTIFDNTIKITDNQSTPQTRVQIGEDAQGDYNMYVYSPQGVLMFDAVYGVTSDGISNNAVGGDKIKDESITSNKLVIDEIFANKGFISELQAVELRAEQITTGKISGEHIDISGVVSFDSFNADLKENFIFDTTGNKTFINGGQLYTNTVTAEKINAKGLTVLDDMNKTTFHIDNKGEVFVTGTMQSSNYQETGNVGYKISKNGDIVMNNAIVRGDVLLPNAGITNFNANSEINEVRFWAGTGFENRHKAPFRVLQDGSFIASRGEIGGTFTGELHIGNIHISDTNQSTALLEIKNNSNTETKIQFTDNNATFNVPTSFGNGSNRAVEIDASSSVVKFNQVRSVFNHDNGYTSFNRNGGVEFTSGEYTHAFTADTGNMYFSSRGKSADTDFTFDNMSGNVKVNIQGELNVDNIIRLGEMKIAKRTGSNAGVDFIL